MRVRAAHGAGGAADGAAADATQAAHRPAAAAATRPRGDPRHNPMTRYDIHAPSLMRPIDSSTAEAEPCCVLAAAAPFAAGPGAHHRRAAAPADVSGSERGVSPAGAERRSVAFAIRSGLAAAGFGGRGPGLSLNNRAQPTVCQTRLCSRQDRVCWPIVSDSAADRSGRVACRRTIR